MRQWDPCILELMGSETAYMFGHLYTVTLASGVQDFFTDMDVDVIIPARAMAVGSWPAAAGTIYKSNSLRIEGMRMKLSVGTEVDEQDVKILALPGDTLAGSNFLGGVAQGLLDGAYVRRDRIFWPFDGRGGWSIVTAPATGWPLAGELSYMRVSTITKIGRSHVELKLKSPLELLNTTLPRRYYQRTCQWVLFQGPDSEGFGCNLTKSNFAVNYKVNAAWMPSPTSILVDNVGGSLDPGPGINIGFGNGASVIGGTQVNGAFCSYDGTPTFAQGQLVFTSGALNGQTFLIGWNDATRISPMYPIFDYALIAPGDTFICYPGCTKTLGACSLKFGTNAAGGDYVAVAQAEAAALGQPFVPNFSGNMDNWDGSDLVPAEYIGL